MSPNTYSLTAVSAREERQTIDVTFTNNHTKKIKPYPFFPSFYLPRTSTTPFEKILESISRPPLQTISHEYSTQVICKTWNELKQVAQHIHTNTNYFPTLIEPERQFLLTQKWRYFQTFDEKLQPLNQAFADHPLPGLVDTLHTTLEGARQHNPKIEQELRERMVGSHELNIPYTDTPQTLNEQLHTLLENHFFTHQRASPIHTKQYATANQWSHAQRTHANELFFHTPREGEGKCTCCTPTTSFHASIHEGSVIETRVIQDGVYIHTHNTEWSEKYHAQHASKEKRLARQKEFGLATWPIGPLFRNEKIILPIHEAREEIKQGTLSMENNSTQTYWKCARQPFIMEKLHQTLRERVHVHETQQNVLTQPYLNQYQLAYTKHAAQDPLLQIHTLAMRKTKEWLASLPNYGIYHSNAWTDATHAQLLERAVLRE